MTSAPASARAPYKLFDYYTFADQDLFFGREEEVMRTVGEVLSTRLLVLFAPSGSGKSSLINAGVRPKLEERGYATVTVRFDCLPDLAIKRRLRDKLPAAFAALTDETELLKGLRDAYARKEGEPPPRPLVLFLDQFEEFFIIWRDKPAVRRAFVQQLAAIKFEATLPVYLVLSLRDDYFVNLNEFRDEIPSIFHNNANIQLRPLNDDAALRAIVEPARRVRLEFEPGLAGRIRDDLKALQAVKVPEPLDRNPSHREAIELSEAKPNATAAATAAADEVPGEAGRGPESTSPDPHDVGVLPITLQIVCHNLWLRRPPDGGPITRVLYEDPEKGLGGAAAIIRNQLGASLERVPRVQWRLMRRLFKVLMTADLTKRLRSLDDLAVILGITDQRRLEAVLKNLTEVSILREEHSDKLAWYEFRHDYLVPQVAMWLDAMERRLARRRLGYVMCVGLIPALILLGVGFFHFQTFRVRVRMGSSESGELVVERSLNPLAFRVETGLFVDDLDFETPEGAVLLNELVAGGIRLRFGNANDWRQLQHFWSDEAKGRFMFCVLEQPTAITLMLTNSVEDVVRVARVDREVRSVLADLLGDGDPLIRRNASEALGKLGTLEATVVGGLRALSLQDKDALVRLRAAEALVGLGEADEQVVDGLLETIKVRETAIQLLAFGTLVLPDQRVVDGLLAALKETPTDSNLRRLAFEATIQMGFEVAPSVEALLPFLQDSIPSIRSSAAKALASSAGTDTRVLQGLLLSLEDGDGSVRENAATLLGQSGSTEASVVEGLRHLLKDGDPRVRIASAVALGRLDKADASVAEGLLPLLANAYGGGVARAAQALGQLGMADAPILARLLHVIGMQGPLAETSRAAAAAALVQLGKGSAAVFEGLQALLTDGRASVRSLAATSLGQLGRADDLVLAGLRESLGDSDSTVRLAAAKALASLGKSDGPVVARLLALLEDTNSNIRKDAVKELVGLGKADDLLLAGLRKSLGDSDSSVRLAAAKALVSLGKADGPVVARLLALLEDSDLTIGKEAVKELVGLGKAEAPVVAGLLAVLRAGDSSSSLRLSAAQGLVELGRTEDPVVEGLISLIRDSDASEREDAAEVLVRLGQEREDWTEERLLQCLQSDRSGLRTKAGKVFAGREDLSSRTYDRIMSLRHDPRPWVRLAAWDALVGIEDAREARSGARAGRVGNSNE